MLRKYLKAQQPQDAEAILHAYTCCLKDICWQTDRGYVAFVITVTMHRLIRVQQDDFTNIKHKTQQSCDRSFVKCDCKY